MGACAGRGSIAVDLVLILTVAIFLHVAGASGGARLGQRHMHECGEAGWDRARTGEDSLADATIGARRFK